MAEKTMDWDRLKTFYLVANSNSFLEAAKRLNITQSSLSKSISILEHQLKVQLFTRHPRGISLTKQGQEIYTTVKQIYHDLEKINNAIIDERNLPQGTLKVTATHGIANLYLVKIMPLFLKLYPMIQLQIIASDLLPDFEFGEADVALCPYLPLNENLIEKRILSHPIGMFASTGYLKQHGTPQKTQDLDHHQLIGFSVTSGSHVHSFNVMNWHLTLGMPQGSVRTPYATMNTAHGRLLLAEQGLGIACVAADHPGITQMDIVPVLPDIKRPELETCIIYAKQRKDSMRIKVFEKFLMEHFGKQP